MINDLRIFFQKLYYCKIKRDKVAYARKLGVTIGEHCQILAKMPSCFGTEPWLIRCGDHVDITSGVKFLNHEGGIWCARGINPKLEKYDLFKPIIVGNNVMIGVNSLIMPGVKIGDNVIIAGHSVVTKDVPSNSIVAGTPAKPISTMEKFISKLEQLDLVPTKQMTQEQKRVYLMKNHPEWF